ncbi:hypothetical protein BHE74_00018318 [Ensete ventricosum]|nr:hypothetical protein BHE74_00018318 [Ensete ventricosum]
MGKSSGWRRGGKKKGNSAGMIGNGGQWQGFRRDSTAEEAVMVVIRCKRRPWVAEEKQRQWRKRLATVWGLQQLLRRWRHGWAATVRGDCSKGEEDSGCGWRWWRLKNYRGEQGKEEGSSDKRVEQQPRRERTTSGERQQARLDEALSMAAALRQRRAWLQQRQLWQRRSCGRGKKRKVAAVGRRSRAGLRQWQATQEEGTIGSEGRLGNSSGKEERKGLEGAAGQR